MLKAFCLASHVCLWSISNVLETCRYVPAKYAPPPASAQQAALAKVKSLESLDVIGKLVRNVVVAPAEEKFRRVKLTNAKVLFYEA